MKTSKREKGERIARIVYNATTLKAYKLFIYFIFILMKLYTWKKYIRNKTKEVLRITSEKKLKHWTRIHYKGKWIEWWSILEHFLKKHTEL